MIQIMRQEILPLLKKQSGFLEVLALVPEVATEKMIAITIWTEKYEAQKYAKEIFPRIEQTLKPYLSEPIAVKHFTVESRLCEKLFEALHVGV
ncbi:MAG TPA: hypothetical protein VMH04_21110 [Candidatus Solibacter sp.]|nr:hypothetical protein [Candidatus Solibacter sp.]